MEEGKVEEVEEEVEMVASLRAVLFRVLDFRKGEMFQNKPDSGPELGRLPPLPLPPPERETSPHPGICEPCAGEHATAGQGGVRGV